LQFQPLSKVGGNVAVGMEEAGKRAQSRTFAGDSGIAHPLIAQAS